MTVSIFFVSIVTLSNQNSNVKTIGTLESISCKIFLVCVTISCVSTRIRLVK